MDSSVWIEYFNGVENNQTEVLNGVFGVKPVAIGDLILTEGLQGFKKNDDYLKAISLFEELVYFDLVG